MAEDCLDLPQRIDTMEKVGKVLLSTSLGYRVHLTDGSEILASRRKNLDIKKGSIIIGDMVELDDDGLIADILPRTNMLTRPRVTNLDQAGVIISAMEPSFSSFLLDKYLSSCCEGNVPAFIIVSKWDLTSQKDKDLIDSILKYYERLGYSIYRTSKENKGEDDRLKEKLVGKVSIFMGQTGVGKSSLINRLDSNFKREIGEEVVQGRGMHKTKEVAFLPFLGGYLGDTPGFSDFSLTLTKEQLALDFPGFFEHAQNCKFKGCLHNSIKGCAVKEAVNDDVLSRESYSNYLRLLDEATEDKGFEKKSSHKEWGRKNR